MVLTWRLLCTEAKGVQLLPSLSGGKLTHCHSAVTVSHREVLGIPANK